MTSPFSIPGAKPTLLLAMTMTLFGFVGISGSVSALTSSPSELAAAGPSVPIELTELTAALLGEPLRRAINVANLIASVLLLVASFLMTGRARSGLWWTGQALWANAGYSVAAAAANAYLLHAHGPAVVRSVEAMAAAQPGGAPLPPGAADVAPWFFVGAALVYGALLAALYVVMLRVARREAVQKFVRREA